LRLNSVYHCHVSVHLELFVSEIYGSACLVICDFNSFLKWFWFEIIFQLLICDFDLKSLLSYWFVILIWNQSNSDLSHHWRYIMNINIFVRNIMYIMYISKNIYLYSLNSCNEFKEYKVFRNIRCTFGIQGVLRT